MKLLIILLLVTSCAQLKEDFIANSCNEESAYSSGMNAANANKESNLTPYSLCPESVQAKVRKAYLNGYREVQNNPVNLVKDIIGFTQYTCKLSPFVKTYTATHARINYAIDIVKRQCLAHHHEMHCDNPECTKQ